MKASYASAIRTFAFSGMVAVFGVMAASSAAAQTTANASGRRGPDITLTQPTALKTGENQFEVVIKGGGGEPINDAAVSVVLAMSRTATNGWMWKEVKLTPSGNGMYMGSGKVASRGKWETTIKVKKDGKKIAQKKVTLIAT